MNFKQTIIVSSTKEKAFEAVTLGIRNWWGNVNNSVITTVDDEFSVFFEEETAWGFKVTTLNKFDEVRWKCIYANHSVSDLKGIKEEWLNSEIVFNFKKLNTDTIEIFFEHKGLTPELNCYEICDAGWTYFISTSLKQYLETGKGLPNLVG
ncbi:MAG: hypothetical protein R8G66_22970 [Cytophagales bacterium]|nr:hypothetical protein [Cytophagales bacterium]